MADLVHVKGLSDLQKRLDTLPAKIERNIMRGAMRAGMKPIQEAAKQGAAHATGELRDGLKIYTRVQSGRIVARLRATGKHAYVAYWMEYTGAAPHTITAKNRKALSFGGVFFQSIDHPGFKAKPFMRPAMDARAQDAVVAAGEYVKKRLATKEGLDTSDITIEGNEQ